MKTAAILFCLSFAANSLQADPYSAALKQAKSVAGNAAASRQDNVPASPLPPPQNNPPPDPMLEATRQNIAGLRVDFDALGDRTDTNAIAAQKSSLTNHLTAAALGTKPSPASISKLADDLTAATAGNANMHPHHQKLAQDIHAIFNSSHLSPAQQQMIFDEVQKILQNGGAAPDQATNVVNDVKAIAKETQ